MEQRETDRQHDDLTQVYEKGWQNRYPGVLHVGDFIKMFSIFAGEWVDVECIRRARG